MQHACRMHQRSGHSAYDARRLQSTAELPASQLSSVTHANSLKEFEYIILYIYLQKS